MIFDIPKFPMTKRGVLMTGRRDPVNTEVAPIQCFFLSNVHQAIVMFTNPLQCSPILWQTGRLLSGPTFSQLPLRNLFKGKMSIFIHIQTFFLMVKIYEKNSKWFYISCNNRLLFAGLQWPLWWVSHGQQSPVGTPSSLEFLSKTCERNKSMLCISILFAGG